MDLLTMSRNPCGTCGAASQRSGWAAPPHVAVRRSPWNRLNAPKHPEESRAEAKHISSDAVDARRRRVLPRYADLCDLRCHGGDASGSVGPAVSILELGESEVSD